MMENWKIDLKRSWRTNERRNKKKEATIREYLLRCSIQVASELRVHD